jgi:hypothetical protein
LQCLQEFAPTFSSALYVVPYLAGFPRTIEQAKQLNARHKFDLVINLDVPFSEIKRRIEVSNFYFSGIARLVFIYLCSQTLKTINLKKVNKLNAEHEYMSLVYYLLVPCSVLFRILGLINLSGTYINVVIIFNLPILYSKISATVCSFEQWTSVSSRMESS